jgi:hypothetical protein
METKTHGDEIRSNVRQPPDPPGVVLRTHWRRCGWRHDGRGLLVSTREEGPPDVQPKHDKADSSDEINCPHSLPTAH